MKHLLSIPSKMKNSLFILIIVLLFGNCKNDEGQIHKSIPVRFGFEGIDSEIPQNITRSSRVSNEQSSSSSQPVPKFLVVSLRDSQSNIVKDKEKLLLYEFSENKYLTLEERLPTGEYFIEEYLVTDKDDKLIYFAPKEDSQYSKYVKDPLPIKFSIDQENLKVISPQVIPFQSYTDLEKFGYGSLSFDVKDNIITLVMIILDENKLPTNAHLQIQSSRGIVLDKVLNAKVQKIVFEHRKGENYFSFIISKEGYEAFTKSYYKEDLFTTMQSESLLRFDLHRNEEKVKDGDMIISNSQDLENFAKEGYTIVNGDLTLIGVQDLKQLNNLTTINGTLAIHNTSLVSLEGLKQLTSVKGAIVIHNNENLVNLKGLNNIKELGIAVSHRGTVKTSFGLYIEGNKELNDIKDLGNITSIKGGIVIINNTSLNNLEGLEKLTFLGDAYIIRPDGIIRDLTSNFIFFSENSFEDYDDSFFCPLKNWADKNPYNHIVTTYRGTEIKKYKVQDFKKEFLSKCK